MSEAVNPQQLQSILQSGLETLDCALSESQQHQLISYVALMHKWNKAYNLTSVRSPDQMMVKHVLDSLAVIPYVSAKCVIDVGTGPGLPGIPLAIALPEVQFVLLDSLGKRVRFMKQVAFELGLKNVEPVHARVEEHQPDFHYDLVLSRAFASLKDMLHWCQHLVDSQGAFLALKGQYPHDELKEVSEHFHVQAVNELTVPGLIGERHLVTIKKA
ncbi:16S rRNA (guanine(527)-N(7))-methyltransferase RsmG [Alteromonas aestuariivivens]|uniref:16S rRNA (guanine(527)-N(7))-methyltransferase RsmG n=1 Tax=Alteromonas aestuariivivens TaxID=1938339 RepID=UPI001FE8FF98|nr:16S rRNA (guanine(527)-N(7))-methyltransferase RsmG [Alteromonas aestuariivivens]